jgi:hypothetical protein
MADERKDTLPVLLQSGCSLETCGNLGDAIDYDEKMVEATPWQRQILSLVAKEPNDRQIYWIHNARGNVGKSKLMKYLCCKGLAKRVPGGNSQQLRTVMVQKGASRCYVVDLPRARGRDDRLSDLFSALEELKNGWVESSMYGKEATLFMEPPHVIVMSNDPPDLRLASADRWRVYHVDDAKRLALGADPYDPEEEPNDEI